MLVLKLSHVSKRGHWSQSCYCIIIGFHENDIWACAFYIIHISCVFFVMFIEEIAYITNFVLLPSLNFCNIAISRDRMLSNHYEGIKLPPHAMGLDAWASRVKCPARLRSVVRIAWENVIKMVLSVYIPMWSLKSWCSLVLKILLFSRMVCNIFQVIWSEVQRTSHSRVWCYVCPLLVSWVPMFSWEAGWGCHVMPGLGALRRGWARVSGLPSTGIRLRGWVGQRSNPVLCWQQLSSGLPNQIASLGYGQEVT